MDPILEELRRQGSLHSTGRFSFDLEGALRRLGRFLLPAPEEFLLRLVAVAVESEAHWLEVAWDGPPFERNELVLNDSRW